MLKMCTAIFVSRYEVCFGAGSEVRRGCHWAKGQGNEDGDGEGGLMGGLM